MTPAGESPSPARERRVGALSVPPSIRPKAGSRVTPELPPSPPEAGVRVRGGAFGTPQPLPQAWGRGRGGGSRWQQLPLGPSPALSLRPEDRPRKLSRAGGAAASAAWTRLGRERGEGRRSGRGLPSPGERGWESPLGKAKPSLPAPSPSGFRPVVPPSPAPVGLRAPRMFRSGQGFRLGSGELYGCAGCDLKKGREFRMGSGIQARALADVESAGRQGTPFLTEGWKEQAWTAPALGRRTVCWGADGSRWPVWGRGRARENKRALKTQDTALQTGLPWPFLSSRIPLPSFPCPVH